MVALPAGVWITFGVSELLFPGGRGWWMLVGGGEGRVVWWWGSEFTCRKHNHIAARKMYWTGILEVSVGCKGMMWVF